MTPLADPAAAPARAPHRVYRLRDGTRVPNVTTVLAVIAKPQLVRWANRQGFLGVDVEAYRDETALTGTIAHAMAEARLRRKRFDGSAYSREQLAAGAAAFSNFIAWHRSHDCWPLVTEEPLASEAHRYGGTFDLLAEIEGRREIVDLKFTGGIYPEHVVQAAAYRVLAEEHGWHVDAVRIVRMPREPDPEAPYEQRVVSETGPYLEVFMAALALYRAQGALRKQETQQKEEES